MGCLAQAGHAAVESYQIFAAQAVVVLVLDVIGQASLVLALVVVYEYSRYVNAVGTGHAILAVVARNGLHVYNLSGDIVQEFALVGTHRLQRAVGYQVVLEMLHVRHSAEYGQHAVGCAGISECPRGHTALRCAFFHFRHHVLRYVGKTASEKRLHYYGWYAAFLQFGVQVLCVCVARVYLIGIFPVEVVKLYLHEVPLVLVVL